MRKRGLVKTGGSKTRTTLRRPIEILMVEDNVGDAILLKETLKSSKFLTNLEVIRDGKTAMEYLEKISLSGKIGLPDIILLDLNLPKKDGHEVLLEIKRSRRLSAIPVIVFTNSDQDEDRWKAYRVHADAYLLKPGQLFQYGALLNYLEEHWLKDICL